VLVDEMSFVRGALVQGVGVGVLPTFLAAPEVEAGRLVPVLPKLSSPAGSVVLLMPGGRQPLPKVRAFVDLFLGSFRGW
jgi:DNA-binding transcriptional LysR family regulator